MKKKIFGSLLGIAMVGLTMLGGQPAHARSSWYVSFSTGPVCYYPAPVYYRPVVYARPVVVCPPPVVYYPAPVCGGISIGYYHRHRH
ncbi:MAG: hypothetical protein D6691_04610 [Candidatus Hydrogenedentota bacterium]|nr:MAG: hypothetical protein D6691_04610 [Candidatus Hydrogenedentota bacterium]